jgi:hypothetical protein
MFGTAVTATFHLPSQIAEGLANGTLERMGDVVREANSKKVVAWLRETFDVTDPNGIQSLNLRLDSLGNLMHLNMAMSALTLGATVAGFAVINQRLSNIESRLNEMQEILTKIDQKLDLRFYSDFRAALDSAAKAFAMKDEENGKNLALQMLHELAKSEHAYSVYLKENLQQQGRVAHEYLSMLALIYLTEVRCHLEIEEHDMALQRLREGCSRLKDFTQTYIEMLLTSNPAAYITPFLKDEISLVRLTQIYRWLDPEVTEANVFERLRINLFQWHVDASILGHFRWLKDLPPAILTKAEFEKKGLLNRAVQVEQALACLPEIMENMESAIETYNRLEGYQTEIQAMQSLDISFRDWLSLRPPEEQPENTQIMCILAA